METTTHALERFRRFKKRSDVIMLCFITILVLLSMYISGLGFRDGEIVCDEAGNCYTSADMNSRGAP